ncbi:MAG: DNA/RNA nuclease SfsA [Hyphomicrobium sp.]|jgi:sugar fermentation stimulation protein A
MRFPSPLVRGRLVQRYKRFLADVILDSGEAITAACPNTGSMLGLSSPGSTVWLSRSSAPSRKYPHTWEMIEADLGRSPALVGINPMHPNKLVEEAIAAGAVEPLAGYGVLRREVKYGQSSRIDLLLEDEAKGRCYVEVKNAHLMRTVGRAEFPDSATARGAKHLAELASMVAQGHRAVMIYLVQRADAEVFSICGDLDPAYLAAFRTATAAGVEAFAYRCHLSIEEIVVTGAIPIAD